MTSSGWEIVKNRWVNLRNTREIFSTVTVENSKFSIKNSFLKTELKFLSQFTKSHSQQIQYPLLTCGKISAYLLGCRYLVWVNICFTLSSQQWRFAKVVSKTVEDSEIRPPATPSWAPRMWGSDSFKTHLFSYSNRPLWWNWKSSVGLEISVF